MTDRRPLFVRLPEQQADRLDRAAFELKTSKQDLVSGMLTEYLGSRRITVETADDALTVGRHSFLATEPSEVLTLDEAADLLIVPARELTKLADKGELPGRRIAGEWRFSRSALLAWLGGGEEA
jgi:excisionase family DNA binding protein